MTKNIFGMTSGNTASGLGYDVSNSNADGYNDFLGAVKAKFNAVVASGVKLFQTNAQNLYADFLNTLPPHARQHYTCRACGTFLNRFGNLVTIDEKGKVSSVLWDEHDVPQFFYKVVRQLRMRVEVEPVMNVFLSDTQKLGNEVTEGWSHIAVRLPKEYVKTYSRTQTVEQATAEKVEDFKMLKNALNDYSKHTVDTALTLLRSESLYRSEKVLGVAEWFREVQEYVGKAVTQTAKDNVIWLSVAHAPTGFTHIRSSMIGTLLNDIRDGYSFEEVSNRFAEKMNPLKYQRPQAAPKLGNIKRGNAIIEKLGLERSLVRRFARVEELETLWKPKVKAYQKPVGGIFGHLAPSEDLFNPNKERMVLPGEVKMTWEKFSQKVLPTADKIEFLTQRSGNYAAILTAEHEDAPPVIQWDSEERRNPFNWYVYSGGSSAQTWALLPNTYVEVTAVTLQPSAWYSPEKFTHHGNSVFFILKGARDKNKAHVAYRSGNALFPEVLKSELHEIRSTIEAFSNRESVRGFNEASACGIRLQKGSNWNAKFRVTSNGVTTLYTLDRWE